MTPDEYRDALMEKSTYGAWLRYVTTRGVIPAEGGGFGFLVPGSPYREVAEDVLGEGIKIPIVDPMESSLHDSDMVNFARRANAALQRIKAEEHDRT